MYRRVRNRGQVECDVATDFLPRARLSPPARPLTSRPSRRNDRVRPAPDAGGGAAAYPPAATGALLLARDFPPATLIAFALAVLIAPLPIGLVTPAGWGAGIVVVGLCLLAWSAAVAIGRAPVAVSPRHVLAPGILYCVPLAWAGLQLFPLGGLVHPLWSSTAEVLGQPVDAAVSVTPRDTLEGIARLAAYAGIFWLALQAGRHGPTAERLFAATAMAAGAYVIYGLVTTLPGMGWLAVYDGTVGGRFSGPLVNANNFATFAGIGLVAATATLYEGFRAAARGLDTAKERRRLKIEYLASRGWPLLISWVLCVSGLLLSQSRAGFLATTVALAVFFPLLALSQHRDRANAWIAAGLAAAAMLVFLALSGGQLIDRLDPETLSAQSHGRSEVFAITMKAIADAPLEGYGLGAFEEVFRLYQPADFPGIWAQAHNSYLENALELGIPAAAAMTLAVAWLALACLAGTFRRRHRRAFPAAGFALCVLVGLHSAVDFPLQIPGIVAVFALLLGVAVAQSWSREEDTRLS